MERKVQQGWRLKKALNGQWIVAQWLAQPLWVPEIRVQIQAGSLSQTQIESCVSRIIQMCGTLACTVTLQ